MDPLKEEEFRQARVKENDDKVYAEFKRIFQNHHQISQDDKAFLQARRSYLTRAEVEEYKDELAENLTGQTPSNPLFELSRKELEEIARSLNIEDPSVKNYKRNADLIEAIQILQSQS